MLTAWLQLLRLPAVFTAFSNIVAAHLIATQGVIQWQMLGLLLGCTGCLYLGGMVLNDCFDADEDARERPSRPIPSGRVSMIAAKIVGALLLIGGLVFALYAGMLQLIIALTLVGWIVVYNGLLKDTVFGAPVMGICRYSNWLLGLSVSGLAPEMFFIALPTGLYVLSLTLLSRVETTARSRVPLATCTFGLLLTTLTIIMLNASGLLPYDWALVLLGGGLIMVLQRLWQTAQQYTPEHIQRTIGLLVLGIIPLDAIMAFGGGPWWGGLIVLALWLPGRILSRLIAIT